MAFDAFLKFAKGGPAAPADGITGETRDDYFKGWIEVKEFTFGIENTLNITSASGGAGAGKADFKEFTVKKQTDISSPYLAIVCGMGGHFSDVQLWLRKSGASGQSGGKPYLKYAFKLVAVKSVEWSGSSGDDVPEETVIFEYGAMKVEYFKQSEDGSIPDSHDAQMAWSKTKNRNDFNV